MIHRMSTRFFQKTIGEWSRFYARIRPLFCDIIDSNREWRLIMSGEFNKLEIKYCVA